MALYVQPFDREQLDLLNAEFEDAHPETILAWAVEQFGDGVAVVTSFQPTGIATLHMLAEIDPSAHVLTLDTGLLFQETYTLMEKVAARWPGLVIERVRPAQSVGEQAAAHGDQLWARDADLCCRLRKVEPLDNALRGFSAWVTGVRRDQSEGRRDTPLLSWDAKHAMVKLSPFAAWTDAMVWTYIHAYDLPYNDLHTRHYPSIGCQPCTRAVAEGEDGRGGRWFGQAKTECGIHISSIIPPEMYINGSAA